MITGASGFIGRYTVARLSKTNHEIVGMVRQTSDITPLKPYDIDLAYADIPDRVALKESMQDIDWLVHLANLYSFWEEDRRDYWRVNVEGTRNVMKCALETGISKVLHISSLLAFGKPK